MLILACGFSVSSMAWLPSVLAGKSSINNAYDWGLALGAETALIISLWAACKAVLVRQRDDSPVQSGGAIPRDAVTMTAVDVPSTTVSSGQPTSISDDANMETNRSADARERPTE